MSERGSNYADVLDQFRAGGLHVEHLEFDRLRKVDVEGDRRGRRSGWYVAHTLIRSDGTELIVGAWGNYRAGIDSQKIKVTGQGLDASERAALREQARRAKRTADNRRRADAKRASDLALKAWRTFNADGAAEHPYLKRKQVGAHGVRLSGQGNLVIPITSADGNIHGLQIIRHKPPSGKREKDYWPAGMDKRGCFHLIGAPDWLVLVCEGYATGASLYAATGFPVAVAFDWPSLLPACQALAKRYPHAKILVCADDDYKTDGNPGITRASAAALAVDGAWVAPEFSTRPENGPKLTDFNDLHHSDGIQAVRVQVEAKLSALEWTPSSRVHHTTLGTGDGDTEWDFSLGAMLERYALIYGTETVFDARLHDVIGLSALRAAATRDWVRSWQDHPARRIVMRDDVVFDPTLDPDDRSVCNLWSGWPTTPRSGKCDRLLELLEYLCGREIQSDPESKIFNWVLDWLAYPVQNPGAKMQTALLVHGPEGSGKNMFFGVIRQIYGEYGGIFGQTELESQFNGWASRKLFMIGNEVVQRAEFYHQQGRLKNMITEPEWQVNEKNMPVRLESNHANFVFFSNRADIAKLDPGDRRFCVVWTPPPCSDEVYRDVTAEIASGGVEALHQYLLDRDLSHFAPWTKPPQTRAKRELTELSRDSVDQFCTAWAAEEVKVAFIPCLMDDLYRAYTQWARAEGVPRAASRRILINYIDHWPQVVRKRERLTLSDGRSRPYIVVPIGVSDPAGKSREIWLSNQVETFAEQLREGQDWPGSPA